MRVSSNAAAIPGAVTPFEALNLLHRMHEVAGHVFLPDDVALVVGDQLEGRTGGDPPLRHRCPPAGSGAAASGQPRHLRSGRGGPGRRGRLGCARADWVSDRRRCRRGLEPGRSGQTDPS